MVEGVWEGQHKEDGEWGGEDWGEWGSGDEREEWVQAIMVTKGANP